MPTHPQDQQPSPHQSQADRPDALPPSDPPAGSPTARADEADARSNPTRSAYRQAFFDERGLIATLRVQALSAIASIVSTSREASLAETTAKLRHVIDNMLAQIDTKRLETNYLAEAGFADGETLCGMAADQLAALRKIEQLSAPGQEMNLGLAINTLCDIWNEAWCTIRKAEGRA